MEQTKKVSFPMIARYNCAIRYIIENGLDVNYVMQPQMTRRTMELGSRYSPDFVCTPFKSSLGICSADRNDLRLLVCIRTGASQWFG